jgi:hypothetical protein
MRAERRVDPVGIEQLAAPVIRRLERPHDGVGGRPRDAVDRAELVDEHAREMPPRRDDELENDVEGARDD